MLMRAEQSGLLIVDIQERLVPALHDPDTLLRNARWLIDVAKTVGVPITATEEHPKGLGHTVSALADALPAGAIVAKEHFSCVAAGCLDGTLAGSRSQLVVSGAETHVCVLQTVIDLVGTGKQVFVVADAVSSRRTIDRDLALARMRQAGAIIVSREMVAFEWLHRAGTDLFRQVNRDFLR